MPSSRPLLPLALLLVVGLGACADDATESAEREDGGALGDGDVWTDAATVPDASPDSDSGAAPDAFDVAPDAGWVDRRAAVVPAGDPADSGPYVVGVHTFELPPLVEGDDPIGVEVWYPAASEGAEIAEYRAFVIDISSKAAYRDVPVDPTAPAFLVAFSHGLYGIRQQNFSMAERLASWGFVVVSADHPGTTTIDLLNTGKLEEALLARPGTVRAAVDAVFDGVVPGLVVREGGIAMVGHSLGSFTAMFIAGGVVDPELYRAGCAADPRPTECGMIGEIRSAAEDIAAAAHADDRVVTTIIQNPAGGFAFIPETLAGIPSPLVMGGERDGLGTNTLGLLGTFAPQATFVVYDGGGHNGPTDICNIELAASFSPDCEGASAGYADPDELREQSVRHAVAWIAVHLGGQPEFARYLGPGDGFVWTEPAE